MAIVWAEPGQAADQPQPAERRGHDLGAPMKAGPFWWVRCKCGWVSHPQETLANATYLHCGVEDAELAGHLNTFRLRRHQTADAEFARMFPPRPQQV